MRHITLAVACVGMLLLYNVELLAQPGDKPRTRDTAEDKNTNLQRYAIGGFGANATETLGIEVNYPNNTQQGVTITSFDPDSKAEEAGLRQYDWILEVDGSAVGLIRNRYYEPWQRYGRSGTENIEVLVNFAQQGTGRRMYYYPLLDTQPIHESYSSLPRDFFTTPKPRDRNATENAEQNKARYKIGYGNFDAYSKWELGAMVEYSTDYGASITNIVPGTAAQRADLREGDMILEVDGAPIGIFNGRVYEVWRQYVYSKDGKVELLIAFYDQRGNSRYFYPEIQLNERSTSSN